MTEWIVRRWARYGHERLYAETPAGTALGYLDLKTGRFHSDDQSNLPLLKEALRDHLSALPSGDHVSDLPLGGHVSGPPLGDHVPAVPSPAAPPPTMSTAAVREPSAAEEPAPPSPTEWVDLSTTQAGAAARARALAEREAQGWLRHGLARLVGARTDERAWRLGADGEEAVAQQLAKLGPDWRVIHAVPVGERGSDIDHVVIGPAGVFTVNAKHHPGASVWVGGNTVMVNGQRVPYVRNSRHEARRAARLLTEQVGFPVTAVGVIAVMGAQKGLTVKEQPEDGQVVVVMRRRISQHLCRRPALLSSGETDAIFEAARRSTTWR